MLYSFLSLLHLIHSIITLSIYDLYKSKYIYEQINLKVVTK